MKTDLSSFDNRWYKPGNPIRRVFWYFTNLAFFRSAFPFNGIKTTILRLYGAQIGKGVVIKPHVNIKYPWRLFIGDFVWIGENVWIDNLGDVRIGCNVCISQGAYLLCGNHNYKKKTFDLMIGDITIHDGAWVGAKSIVCPGVIMNDHSVLTVGSVATSNLDSYSIYQGNPAIRIKKRIIQK